MKRRTVLLGGAALGLATIAARLPAFAQDPNAAPEKPSLQLGVGGAGLLYYLPLSIASRRGFFEEEGLEVAVNDFQGGARSLQALVGGSVDVVTGAFEHTIRMQERGQNVKAICELCQYPGIVIAVRQSLAGEIATIADLAGRPMGVTAPGSSTAMLLQYALVKNGLAPDAVSIVGIGGGASGVAAIKRGEIAGLSHLDPVIARLEADGDIQVLIDTRTEAGTRELFGGPNPAASVYMQQSFIDQNPVTTQRLVNAFMKSLKWLQTASGEEVADVVPSEYHFGDRALYVSAFENAREMFSPDGLISEEGFDSLFEMIRTIEPDAAAHDISFSQVFDPRFAQAAQNI